MFIVCYTVCVITFVQAVFQAVDARSCKIKFEPNWRYLGTWFLLASSLAGAVVLRANLQAWLVAPLFLAALAFALISVNLTAWLLRRLTRIRA